MKNIWFTSDPHFGHGNIIKYCNRPYLTVPEMNEALLENYNKTVKSGDICFIVGDIAFGHDKGQIEALIKRMNGRKIIILGNHDHDSYFKDVQAEVHYRILELKSNSEFGLGKMVTLSHFPGLSWNGSFHGSYGIHGHEHGAIANDGTNRRYDCGVDAHNMLPVHWDHIDRVLSKIPTPKELKGTGKSGGY
jgi:calcineurin-like phosphoesterase family protein